MRRTSSANRLPRGRRLAGRGLALAAVVGLTMLGNLRSQASEVVPGSASDAATVISPADLVPTLLPGLVTAPGPDEVGRLSMLDADGVEDGSDAERLVPAIYAWNPDVRFVYFRHVSKWM